MRKRRRSFQTVLKFIIPGEPQGKGRPRFSSKTGTAYTPSKTKNYETLVQTQYRRQLGNARFPDGVPLEMRIKAYCAIPKSASKVKGQKMLSGQIRPVKKPDWDNIGKIVADSLNGIAYKDDSQIVDGQVKKFFSLDPRVEVTIIYVEEDNV